MKQRDEKTEFGKIRLQRKDMLLIGFVVAVAVLAIVFHAMIGGVGAGSVTVKVDGKIQGVYSLSEDQSIKINKGSNILEIRNGFADMTEANCPDKLCVHQKRISKNGESIICLPNKVVVTIDSAENSDFDAVAQ